MRKLIGTLVLLGACQSAPAPATRPAPATVGNQTGAADGASAVRAFLAAAAAQDLQAMSGIFGTAAGASRETIPRDELDKREIIMMKCLAHDSYQIISDAPGGGGQHVYVVALKRRALTRTTNFRAVSGPGSRWYVESYDVTPIQDFCTGR